jgi:hypothetical protein
LEELLEELNSGKLTEGTFVDDDAETATKT